MYSREIESSVQMRLYSMTKRHFVVLIFLFLLSFGLCIIIGISGPQIILSYSINYTSFKQQNNKSQYLAYSLTSKPVSVFNQQLWLTAKFTLKTTIDVSPEVSVKVTIFGKSQNGNRLIYNGSETLSKRKFKCMAKECEEILIAHINFINEEIYKFDVKIFTNKLEIENIDFTFSTFSNFFSQLEIWFRFSFLVFGFIATIIYNNSLRKFSIRDWSMEQRWVAILLPTLVIYNNPLIPLKFIVNSPVTGVIDQIFQATFFCLLMLFWVTIYHGMRQIKRQFISFHLPKISLVLVIWIMIIILPTYQAFHESNNPTFYYKLEKTYAIYKWLLLSALGIYVLYALFLIITACGELRSIPYFNVRIKFFAFFMFFILIFNIVMISLRFGSGLFNDNFVFESASRYNNSVEFCAQFGIINLYLFAIAYAYSPSKNAIHEANFQDDPNISMLNESDEDVLYGSEMEATSLLSQKDIKTKQKK